MTGHLTDPMENPDQSELESFRRQWREEVAAKTKQPDGPSRRGAASKPGPSGPGRPLKRNLPSMTSRQAAKDDVEGPDLEGQAYHDLEDKEEHLKLSNDTPGARDAAKGKEPRSALEHYERAVERETQGSLGDSVSHYRKAFKVYTLTSP